MSRHGQHVEGQGRLQLLMPWHSTVGFKNKAFLEYQEGLFDVIEFLVRMVQESVARCRCDKCGKKCLK